MALSPRNGSRPTVLLTNDDGPPCASSPNIFAFAKLLSSRLGWNIKVVIPDCQKSWVGKAYAISDIISASYFYPLEPDGLKGEITTLPRPLKEGETMEWILLSGTPATCANIAIHNLYPDSIDLVISGPNHGRNSSTAFALSSGTLGASLASALSAPSPSPSAQIPSIAVSYGVVTRPVSPSTLELAHDVSVDICARLWDQWGYEAGPSRGQGRRTPVYTVNVPLVDESLTAEGRKVCWTSMWRSGYGQLFKSAQAPKTSKSPSLNKADRSSDPNTAGTSTAGPAALPTPAPSSPAPAHDPSPANQQLHFQFGPTMGPLLFPSVEALPHGSDAWAFAKGYISVTPLRAAFAGLGESGEFDDEAGRAIAPGDLWSKL